MTTYTTRQEAEEAIKKAVLGAVFTKYDESAGSKDVLSSYENMDPSTIIWEPLVDVYRPDIGDMVYEIVHLVCEELGITIN